MSSQPVSTRRLALLSGIALLGVFGAVSVCNAESPWRRRVRPAPPPPYRVSLESLSGEKLPTFRQADGTFVLGEPGERYNVRIDNPTPERVEVVLTVDGRDSVSGEVGDYVSQRGYLIEAWGSLVVEGFRRSLDEVAAFRFTSPEDSYSSRRGTPQNVGVIGVAVFPEKPRPRLPVRRPAPRPVPRREEAPRSERYEPGAGKSSAAPSARGDDRERYLSPDDGSAKRKGGSSNIGTEYGESQSSSVVEVAFERRSPTHPSALISVRYDDYDGLEARGIDVSSLRYAYRDEPAEPDPFPRSPRRFAPAP